MKQTPKRSSSGTKKSQESGIILDAEGQAVTTSGGVAIVAAKNSESVEKSVDMMKDENTGKDEGTYL